MLRLSERGPTSPFWIGFSLTLTETFGATVLALPIAVAGPGPVPGLIALLVLGLVSILTIAAFAEAFSRDGGVRSGKVMLGGLVESLLGKPISFAIRLVMVAFLLLLLCAYYIGVGTTVGDELPISPLLVTGIMFLSALPFLFRESLGSAVSASLLVGSVNIVLIVAIAALSLGKLHPAYLAFADTPFYGGHHFYFRVVGLLVGVLLAAFFGHLSVGTCAADVLRRDPSGRTLLWGCVTAEATVMVLYVLWIITVNGSVPRRSLMGDHSTVLVPLASVVGGGVRVLGLIFVVLAMGMASVQCSIGLRDTVREWLPEPETQVVGRERWRTLLPLAPVAAVFLVTEWFLWHGFFSFSAVLAYIGIAVVSILGGFLPLALVTASRRKGDRAPGTVLGFLGNRVVLTALYLVFLVTIAAHGIIIWTNPEERATAVAIGVSVTAAAVWIARTGVFKARLAVEVRADPDRGKVHVAAFSAGRPSDVTWIPTYVGVQSSAISGSSAVLDGASLQSIVCLAATEGIAQLRVWVHAGRDSGGVASLPATVELLSDTSAQRFILGGRSDACLIPLNTAQTRARISFSV